VASSPERGDDELDGQHGDVVRGFAEISILLLRGWQIDLKNIVIKQRKNLKHPNSDFLSSR